jgi:hypothetical protein
MSFVPIVRDGGSPDNLFTGAGKINDGFASVEAAIAAIPNMSLTPEGYISADNLALNSQSGTDATDNYNKLDAALKVGSAAKRLVVIPGVVYISRGFRYDGTDYRNSGFIGLGSRGQAVLRFADTLTGSGGDRVWMFNLVNGGEDGFHFTLKNVSLDGNFAGNAETGSTGVRMEVGFAEYVLLEDVDTYNFQSSGRMLMGGRTENAVTDRNGRAWNLDQFHGFSTRGDMDNFGTPVVFENAVAWSCAGRNVDISRGRAVMRGNTNCSNIEDMGVATTQGNFKISASADGTNYVDSFVADRLISNDSPGAGFETTGEPYVDMDIRYCEIRRAKQLGMRCVGSKRVKIDELIFDTSAERDCFLIADEVDIGKLVLLNSNTGDVTGSNYPILIRARSVRIGQLIAYNCASRILGLVPDFSAIPSGHVMIADIGYVDLHNNNKNGNSNSAHAMIETDAISRGVLLTVHGGRARDDRGTPLQTRIFRAVNRNDSQHSNHNLVSRIDIRNFVRGAGAGGAGWVSTAGASNAEIVQGNIVTADG